MKFSDNYQELTFFQSYDENGKHNIISTLQTSKVRILMKLINQLYSNKLYCKKLCMIQKILMIQLFFSLSTE